MIASVSSSRASSCQTPFGTVAGVDFSFHAEVQVRPRRRPVPPYTCVTSISGRLSWSDGAFSSSWLRHPEFKKKILLTQAMCEGSRAKRKPQVFSSTCCSFTSHFMTQTAFNYPLRQNAPFPRASWWICSMCELTERFLLFCPGAVVDKSSGKVLVVQDRNKVLCRTRLFIQH